MHAHKSMHKSVHVHMQCVRMPRVASKCRTWPPPQLVGISAVVFYGHADLSELYERGVAKPTGASNACTRQERALLERRGEAHGTA